MRPWFTTEQLSPDTWAISEYRHWEETHCYLLTGTDRALLIDTGLPVLKEEGKLRHGAGVFQYGGWGIWL